MGKPDGGAVCGLSPVLSLGQSPSRIRNCEQHRGLTPGPARRTFGFAWRIRDEPTGCRMFGMHATELTASLS